MPTLPQFFRHFVPKIRSKLSSGTKGKSEKFSASTEQSGSKPRKAKAFSSAATKEADSSFGNGESYVTLGRVQEVGSKAPSDVEAHGWNDEASEGRGISRDDEEKGLGPLGNV